MDQPLSAVIRHIALFRWNDEAQIDPQEVTAELMAIADDAGAVSFAAGPALGYGQPTYDYAVMADFPSREGYLGYRQSLRHRQYLEEILRPAASHIAGIQVEVRASTRT